MGIEFVFFGVVLSVAVAVLARSVAARRRHQAPAGRAGSGTRAGTSTGVGPVAAAFPIERNEHERRVGDAAFIDGLIVGRYFFPHQPEQAEDRRATGEAEHRDSLADDGAGSDDGAGEDGGVMPLPGVDHAAATGVSDLYAPTSHEFDALDPDLDLDDEHTVGWTGVDEGFEDDELEDPVGESFGDAFGDAFDDGFDDTGDW